MPDFWPISASIRSGVMNHNSVLAIQTENPRHAIAACRILFAASLLNLRNRLLPRPYIPRPTPLKGTGREYEEYLRSDQKYLDYLHDWKVFKAGYPPGHELKYLEFKIIPCVTPQAVYDPEKDNYKNHREWFYPPEEELYEESWDHCDLWPIRPELREPAINRLLRIIADKSDVGASLAGSRAMLTASSINLRYQKAPEMRPPQKPWAPLDPDERDFFDLEFCDGQHDSYLRDREMCDSGFPPGETFRWLHSPARISEHLVDWERVNYFLAKNDKFVEDG